MAVALVSTRTVHHLFSHRAEASSTFASSTFLTVTITRPSNIFVVNTIQANWPGAPGAGRCRRIYGPLIWRSPGPPILGKKVPPDRFSYEIRSGGTVCPLDRRSPPWIDGPPSVISATAQVAHKIDFSSFFFQFGSTMKKVEINKTNGVPKPVHRVPQSQLNGPVHQLPFSRRKFTNISR